MVGKKRIEVWLDYDDYIALKEHSILNVSEQIRRALLLWFNKPEPTIEKLQKVIGQYENLIVGGNTITDDKTLIPLSPADVHNENRATDRNN